MGIREFLVDGIVLLSIGSVVAISQFPYEQGIAIPHLREFPCFW